MSIQIGLRLVNINYGREKNPVKTFGQSIVTQKHLTLYIKAWCSLRGHTNLKNPTISAADLLKYIWPFGRHHALKITSCNILVFRKQKKWNDIENFVF